MITFNVDPSSYSGFTAGESVVHLVGDFNGWNPGDANLQLSDDDGDGIHSITIPLEDGDYTYKYTLGGWDTQEFWSCEKECLERNDGGYWNRTLTVAGEDQVLDFVHWNMCAGEEPLDPDSTITINFEVNAAHVTVATTIYAGGGFLGDAMAVPLSDDDGDGVYTGSTVVPEGSGGNYIYLNSPTDGGNWDAKEQLGGQECADPLNWNDRLSECLFEDTTFSACFGDCSAEACAVVEPADCSFDVFMSNTGDWPSEITWNITSAAGEVVMSGTGSSTDVQVLEAYYGESFTLNMADSYADGWNGGTLSIGGEEYTIEDGAEGTAEFACEPYTCEYDVTMSNPGDWPSEITWEITDADGTVVLSGDASAAGLTLSVAEGVVYTLTMYDSYGDGWNGGILNIGGNEYTIADGAEGTAEITCTQEVGISAITAAVSGPYSGTATFDFSTTNFTVGAAGEGDGHIHWSINDGAFEGMLYESSLTLENLPDGTHVMTAFLADDAHNAIEGATTAEVEFTIATLACDSEAVVEYPTNFEGVYATVYNPGGTVSVIITGATEGCCDTVSVTDGSGNVLVEATGGDLDIAVESADGVINVILDSDGSVTDTFTITTICGGLSTEDNNILDMTVYPNPVMEERLLTILSPVNGEMKIEIFSLTGRKIMHKLISDNKLDVSSLQTGFYMMKVSIDDQSKIFKLIIK